MALPPFELLLLELTLRLLWGSWIAFFFVARIESSERFLRIAAKISVVTILLVFALSSWTGNVAPAWMAAYALFLGGMTLYVSLYQRSTRIAGFALLLLSPLCAVHGFANIFNFLSGSLLLGGFFASQFLGHWFLNVPGMNIHELRKTWRVLAIGLSLKTLECGWTLFWAWRAAEAQITDTMGRPFGGDPSQSLIFSDMNASATFFDLKGVGYMGLGMFGWLLLAMRLLWGIVAPWILALMIRSTLRTRSTQSATGILYAACVLVLIGEGSALYLRATLGWPL